MQLSILILAQDKTSAQSLTETLSAAGHGVTVVTRPEDFAAAAASYGLSIVDTVAPPLSPTQVISLLKAASAGTPVAVMGIAQTADIDERIGLLEAGADDVITRPFPGAELLARVDAMALAAAPISGGTAGAIGGAGPKRVVGVFSPKGGVGTTTVATNVATVAADRMPGRVLLMDLDLSFGQVASHLNLQPRLSILDLTRDELAMREPELLRTYTVSLPGGLSVLAAPPSPAYAGYIRADQVAAILARALDAFDVVIVDAGTAMEDRLGPLFARADTVLVPVLPEIPTLNAVRLLLEQLADTGSLGASTMFVLNNVFARELLRRADIESALDARIAAELPYDPFVYLKAANEGVPVVTGSPKSAAADKLRALTDVVLNGSTSSTAEPRKERRGLFGRR